MTSNTALRAWARRGTVTTLSALAAALIVAFVAAPPVLAAGTAGGYDGERGIIATFRAAVTGDWRAGGRDLTPGLDRIVDYWFRYHLAKAVIAALLLAVLIALASALWQVYQRSGGAAVTSAGVAVTLLALSCVAVV